MKKFLRFYLPLLLALTALGVFTLRYLVVNHENALKCLRECRVISAPKSAVVKIDGVESTGSKIFEDEKNYYLVSDIYKKDSFSLMIIDKSKNDVTFPTGCYDTIFSSYLLLPDCAGGIFLSDSVKGNGFDSQLKITGSNINFVVPENKHFDIPEHKIEILYQR